MLIRKSAGLLFLIFIWLAVTGCMGGLVAPAGGQLTDKDLALDKYYQALKWSNNTVENIIANIKLMPVEEQKAWIQRVDPLKTSIDSALALWKEAVGLENYEDVNAQRAEFKRIKNQLLDLLLRVSEPLG